MIEKIKSHLENTKTNLIAWVFGISGVLMVRFFLESISSRTSTGFFASDASTLVHYFLFFMTFFLVFLIFLEIVIPKWKHVAPQIIVFSSPIIWLAPIIDWLVGKGEKITMAYIFEPPKDLLLSFLSFFGKNWHTGITIGMRVEIFLAIFGFAFLVFAVEKSFKKSIISFVSVYLIAFLAVSFPSIFSIFAQSFQNFDHPLVFFQKTIESSSTVSNLIHSSLRYSSMVRIYELAFNSIISKIFLIVLVLLSSFWFYKNHKNKFFVVIKNSRPERVFHYLFMIFIGILSAYIVFGRVMMNWNDWLSVLVLCLSFYFSWMFAVFTNDLADEEIDKISNKERPIISGRLNKEEVKQVSFVFISFSLLSAFVAGYTSFFFVLSFTALYYVYSVLPVRLKIVPIFSSFIIGLCALTAVMAGFFLVSPIKKVFYFPDKLILAVVLIFTLLSNIRDMKDTEGDKKAGIKTLPVILGDFWGPKIIGGLSFISFLLIPIFSGINELFVSALPIGLLSYYLVNKKPYQEKPLVWIYLAFILFSALILFV